MTDVTSATSTTSTNIAAGQKSLNTTYTEFLTLLTTQLKNQDPSQPLDTNAFTQQLVSMTGVQQQLLSNQLLQQIAGQTQDGGVASSVGLIGKTATAASSNAVLSGGSAQWSYNLAADAGLAASRGEARRLALGGGLRLNDKAEPDAGRLVTLADLQDGALKLAAGKKKVVLLKPV